MAMEAKENLPVEHARLTTFLQAGVADLVANGATLEEARRSTMRITRETVWLLVRRYFMERFPREDAYVVTAEERDIACYMARGSDVYVRTAEELDITCYSPRGSDASSSI